MTDALTPLSGPNILLMGPGGTGKTWSLGTLVDWCAKQSPPKEVFVLFTENGLETLLGYWRDGGKEVPMNLHWNQQLTRPLDIASLMTSAKNLSMLSLESLAKAVDPLRGTSSTSFYKILGTFADFSDNRTGKSFGCVQDWSTDRVFVIDSLTELANAAVKAWIGNKAVMSPSDYGVAQGTLLNFLRLCTQGSAYTFVLTAHVTRETDEVLQTTKTVVKAIGKAQIADIPPLFSDVIYTVRDGTDFWWDTAAYGVDTKTRSLGYRSKIKPDFGQIMDLWVKRGGK